MSVFFCLHGRFLFFENWNSLFSLAVYFYVLLSLIDAFSLLLLLFDKPPHTHTQILFCCCLMYVWWSSVVHFHFMPLSLFRWFACIFNSIFHFSLNQLDVFFSKPVITGLFVVADLIISLVCNKSIIL